ncbi:MAG TPA: TIM44-like domain-containing protein [Xanthobacteraceae bacterium]|nr:TIM44-like domain-containing protein [Xanthobacteraceae bacterium]
MIRSLLRKVAPVLAVVLALGMLAGTADARVGGGFSMGSRGARTFSPPPMTRTAPNVSPLNRSVTQPAQPGFNTPRTTPGFFGRGLFGGLLGGFFGAGLLGLLFGYGFFGGMGGFASVLGLILQVGLVVLIGRLLWTMWQRRQPAFAGSGPMLRDAGGQGFGGYSAGTAGGRVDISRADYDAFERLLGEIQTAYSNEDIGALRSRVTPEMLSYFSEQLSENASRGVVNQVSNVRLLQGDLAEAWYEGSNEYATVAMRFALTDRTVDRASGRLVDGSDSPQEVTEVWTFMRVSGGRWVLSAIQQA